MMVPTAHSPQINEHLGRAAQDGVETEGEELNGEGSNYDAKVTCNLHQPRNHYTKAYTSLLLQITVKES